MIPPSHPDTPFYPPFVRILVSEKFRGPYRLFITYIGLQFLVHRKAEFELHGNVHVRLFEITAGYVF